MARERKTKKPSVAPPSTPEPPGAHDNDLEPMATLAHEYEWDSMAPEVTTEGVHTHHRAHAAAPKPHARTPDHTDEVRHATKHFGGPAEKAGGDTPMHAPKKTAKPSKIPPGRH